MILPDFIGMDPDVTEKILKDRYPHISYHIQTYFSPWERKSQDASVTYRIVRQKLLGDNQLNLIISPFYLMNE